ncbi:DUF6053 domain-containing protein [Lysobacter enzymogenes]|uniref:DUF6053 domain-containing protein n=1 Tax=Lysobacter enzymogenes TaxID=69 RepID=UPI003CCDA0B2
MRERKGRRWDARLNAPASQGVVGGAVRAVAANWPKSVGPEGPPTKALQALDSKVVSRPWPPRWRLLWEGLQPRRCSIGRGEPAEKRRA